MGSRLQNKARSYAIYFLGWTGVVLYFFSQDLTRKFYWHDPTPWWHFLVSWAVGIYVCALFTIGIVWLCVRFPIEKGTWARRIPLHLLFSLIFSVLDIGTASLILPLTGVLSSVLGRSFRQIFPLLMVISFHQTVVTYWTILTIEHALRNYRKYQEREQQALRLELRASGLQSQLMRAQLNALKMQLQPHFLFNTLNAIMVLVRQQRGRQAEEMLGRLSDLLRWVLEDVDTQEVPLRRELEYLQLYLSIEQVRFQDRLRVEINADPAVLEAAVPHMGLQPIVENAIRHGIGKSSTAGRIQISASRANGVLELKVLDDGPGLPPAAASGGRGIGLTNTRARLDQLYGDAGRLTVENGKQGGVLVTMLVPYHVAPALPENLVLHAFDNADR